MPPLVFVSGWGCRANIWDGYVDALPGFSAHCRTYYQLDPLPDRFIGVGHSLGVRALLAQAGDRLAGLVSIGGFLRFPVPSQARALALAYGRDPVGTLAGFFSAHGLPPAYRDGCHAANLDGLRLLARPMLPLPLPPVFLALQGGRDRLLQAPSFPGVLFHPDADHGLPFNRFSWCLWHVKAFVQHVEPSDPHALFRRRRHV
jgi:pimeloyl-ACP methyl ester carboxylesterase